LYISFCFQPQEEAEQSLPYQMESYTHEKCIGCPQCDSKRHLLLEKEISKRIYMSQNNGPLEERQALTLEFVP
jgi:hypothetical protein